MLPFKRRLMAGLVKPIRSKAYLTWVKSLPCCGCGAPADDAHHLIASGLGGGMGTKADDCFAIPLCRGCHTELHNDVKQWEERNGTQCHHFMFTIRQAIDEQVIDL